MVLVQNATESLLIWYVLVLCVLQYIFTEYAPVIYYIRTKFVSPSVQKADFIIVQLHNETPEKTATNSRLFTENISFFQ
jgi:hypothetical protein